jgi:hypothetical protein
MEGDRDNRGVGGAGVVYPDGMGVDGNVSIPGLAKTKYRVNPSALEDNFLPRFWNVEKSSGAKRAHMTSLGRRRCDTARPTKFPSAALRRDLMEEVRAKNSSDATLLPKS